MIKSYLINMQRSSDRLQAMSARFQALGMPFERIPAFDGATLTPEQIADFVRERPLEGSGDGFSTGPRKWTASNIGCFLSHQAAWRIAADSDDAYTAIFEDDMHLSDALPALLRSTEWLPAGNSIVRLEPSYNRIKLDSKVADIGGRQLRLVRPSTYQHCWPVCAGALIISRDAARLLLAAEARWHTMADIFLFGWNESPVAQQLSTYQLSPAACIQDKFFHNAPEQIVFTSTIDAPLTQAQKQRSAHWKAKATALLRVAQGYRKVVFAP
ncbi:MULTISPECIES: glycosyltransferase family 25 protein [Xanthomonas]|uniref:Glycosyl transferase family 25 domain-containing protein n=4 Tax=Xanthomonas hortorum TaxID=56454 RepID=A0A6V7BQ79_9XANT|nr:glycosyltransferase family 25 protein [Xanthomonas hortorum]ETC90216.1 glycosyltransferase [Xanthomonas hortorum pv. carotae str. M081]MCE4354410.1 glycosyltransferase family 25 protein [Xanthomonas hortorum pv. pelargonii]MCE4371399.1 glycosyltransferase family 25 protein [Xanthomonas hortorum pv. hederae]MCM5523794.1 glycosyltransferase family 25 protein [Xanthomonas hortorum pv. pelargonii]MCM5536377.1 glycosyltransferase family 25 protein [Xanthomonas hortorum pv. pelargonii]